MKYQLFTKNVSPYHTDLNNVFVNTKIAVFKDKDIIKNYLNFLDYIDYNHNVFAIKELSEKTHTLYTLDMRNVSTDSETFMCVNVVDVKRDVPNSLFDTD